ncbi:MAG: hypothetical protein AAF741_03750 [Bacteroidota bacterium]
MSKSNIYYTVECTTKGFHGHKLKDVFGSHTIGKLLGWEYIYTPYPYLEPFAIQLNAIRVPKWRRKLKFSKIYRFSGPKWDGISDYKDAKAFLEETFGSIKPNSLVVIDDSLRIHPCQTISWWKDRLIDKNIFDAISSQQTEAFKAIHGQIQPTDPEILSVAIHISRGVDFNKEKFPQHFEDSWQPRYIFSMEYFDHIIKQIKSVFKDKRVQFNIYTESLNSEDIQAAFSDTPDIKLHIGSNRHDRDESLILDIFKSFVASDILVCCNSSFSAMCSYYRYNKKTIYHPHKHLYDLPAPNYLATEIDGSFNTSLLQTSL